MALPQEVHVRQVTYGVPFAVPDGATLDMAVSFTPNRSLIWAATGAPAIARTWSVVSANGSGVVSLPVTDQTGWRDEDGNALSVAGGAQTHLYHVTVTFLDDDRRQVGDELSFDMVLPTGDGTPVDLDLRLPITGEDGVVVEVPDTWSAQVSAAQAAAAAAQAATSPSGIDTTVSGLLGAGSSATKTAVDARVTAGTSTVGRTGAYSDLTGKPTIPSTKADVGLGNVDNTSDANKPVSTATAAALAAKADLVGGLVPTSQIPALALHTSVTVASQAAMLALTTSQVQPGDLAIRTDGAGTFILGGTGNPATLSNWTLLNAPSDAVSSVNGQSGTVVLAASDVGAAAKSANLSDLASAASARSNLGLGSAATQPSSAFDAAGAASSAQAASLQKSSNLSDLASASAARTALGLGTAAVKAATAFATGVFASCPVGWYLSPQTALATSGGAPVSGVWNYMPIWIGAEGMTFDAFVENVTTAQSGGTGTAFIAALHPDDGTGFPDSGTVLASANSFVNTSVGTKVATFSAPLALAQGLYWVACLYYAGTTAPTTAPQFSCIANAVQGLASNPSTTFGTAIRALRSTSSSFTDIPASKIPSANMSVTTATTCPLIGLRRSA